MNVRTRTRKNISCGEKKILSMVHFEFLNVFECLLKFEPISGRTWNETGVTSLILVWRMSGKASGALDRGRPGRTWTPLASDCKWCRTVNGHEI